MRQNKINLKSKNGVLIGIKDFKFDKRVNNFSWKRLTMRKALRIWSFNRRCPQREKQNEHSVTIRNNTPSNLANIWTIIVRKKQLGVCFETSERKPMNAKVRNLYLHQKKKKHKKFLKSSMA